MIIHKIFFYLVGATATICFSFFTSPLPKELAECERRGFYIRVSHTHWVSQGLSEEGTSSVHEPIAGLFVRFAPCRLVGRGEVIYESNRTVIEANLPTENQNSQVGYPT